MIGANEGERDVKQRVLVNVELEVELDEVFRTDSLADTLDYRELKREILGYVESSSFRLIESLAHGIAEICASKPRVASAKVTVDKPGALSHARSVAAEVTLRGDGRWSGA